ncbi:hypothetical protein CC80DRAFT_494127 [Byssothecium circinans]|uniref:DNA damage-responsive protein 48 n=1 Tax=Byssothecium circinans TaxID=147558 RepID=A0A6A5TMG1_9PLEO|nr:hypothetical protein CC80DRAFT_494127 [Byssothecium circinans]
MDFVNKLSGGGEKKPEQQQHAPSGEKKEEGGLFSGIGKKFNNAAGGGAEGEKNEDYLDKGVDFVQEKFLGQGAQNDESALEQAKDEQISDYIRKGYKSAVGSDVPIKDKPTTFDKD